MSKKKRILIILSILLGAIALVAAFIVINHFLGQGDNEADMGREASIESLYEGTTNILTEDDAKAAQKNIDDQIANESDPVVLGEAYGLKSTLLYSEANPDYNEILRYALMSDEINPTSESADRVALAYENLGDVENEIKYHRLAIEREPDTVPEESSSKPYHEARIKWLQENQ